MALNNISVVLVGPRHAGNVGLVARAMKNTGLSHLVVVKSSKHQSKTADIFGAPARDILQSALSFQNIPGCLKDTTYSVGFTRRVGKTRLPLIPYLDLVPRILARAKSGKVHLIFGNERSGLSTADIVRCDSAAYLPSSPGFSSMNLSHAVMLVGYELQKAFLGKDHLGGVSAQRPERYPTRQAVEATFIEIDALLGKLGYRDYPRFKLLSSIRNNLRRMSKRTMPTIAEINMVRGILARLHQRLL